MSIVATPPDQDAFAIILGFLISDEFVKETDPVLYWYATSLLLLPITLLDSWITYPSKGGLAVTGESDGITYLAL